MREERFITKVVDMHYKQGMSQQEIGKALNVSRPTVSRALTKAKKEGYHCGLWTTLKEDIIFI